MKRDNDYLKEKKTRQGKTGEQDNEAKKGRQVRKTNSCHSSDMLLLRPRGLFWYKEGRRVPLSQVTGA